MLENIRNICPVPTYPWHQLASVSPILYVPAVTKSGVLGNSGSDSGVLESIRCGWGSGFDLARAPAATGAGAPAKSAGAPSPVEWELTKMSERLRFWPRAMCCGFDSGSASPELMQNRQSFERLWLQSRKDIPASNAIPAPHKMSRWLLFQAECPPAPAPTLHSWILLERPKVGHLEASDGSFE